MSFAKVSPNVALTIGATLIIGIILGLGAQRTARVLIIDADLRRPTIHTKRPNPLASIPGEAFDRLLTMVTRQRENLVRFPYFGV